MEKRKCHPCVFKAGATDEVDNYRSISLLLSIPSKCQEKIVHKAIYSDGPLSSKLGNTVSLRVVHVLPSWYLHTISGKRPWMTDYRWM